MQKKVDGFVYVVRTEENNFEKDGMKYYTVELFIKDYHVIDFKEKKQASGDVTEEAPFPPE